jgi:N-acyl-D-aspartate/D-glutamate deacylase
MMEKSRAEGLDITTEVYPYTAASTGINTAVFDEGWQTKLGISYKDIEWPPTGERFTDKQMWDEYRSKYPQGTVILHTMEEKWLEMALRHPGIMIASDAMKIQSLQQRVHPRGMGTHARVLGSYVREKNILSLADAISRMTYLPAKRLENFTPVMKNKGRIQAGTDADITIFDPNEVIDQATFSDPNKFSKGIKYVIVDGQIVVKDEEILPGVFPGKPISTK